MPHDHPDDHPPRARYRENDHDDAEAEREAVEGPSQNARSMGLLAHLLGLFTGFFGPAILLLAATDKSPFARRHAKESLNYQVALTFYAVAILVVGGLVGVAVYVTTEKQFAAMMTAVAAWTLLGLVMLVFEIVCIIKAITAANRGQDYRYPLNIRLF